MSALDTGIAAGATVVAAAFGLWQGLKKDRSERERLEIIDSEQRQLEEDKVRARFDESVRLYFQQMEARIVGQERRIATLEEKLVARNKELDAEQEARRRVEAALDRAQSHIRHLETDNQELKERLDGLEAGQNGNHR